eukprot:g76942.t1
MRLLDRSRRRRGEMPHQSLETARTSKQQKLVSREDKVEGCGDDSKDKQAAKDGKQGRQGRGVWNAPPILRNSKDKQSAIDGEQVEAASRQASSKRLVERSRRRSGEMPHQSLEIARTSKQQKLGSREDKVEGCGETARTSKRPKMGKQGRQGRGVW